jgi:hypothetical protein
MKLASVVTRFRLGELRDDAALVDAASAEMRELGVRVPAKMAARTIPLGPQQLLSEGRRS